MGALPERYGLELLPNPSGLLEDQAFNEVGGLPWAEKQQQIIRSTDAITSAIMRIKGDPKYWSGAVDLELLFWLYDRLGHDSKRDIVRCYEDAFLGSPAHPKSYVPAMQALLQNGAAHALQRAGMRARSDDIRVVRDTVVLPIETAAQRLELEFRVLGHGASPTFTSGRNLGTSLAADSGFSDALAELIAPGSKLDAAVAQTGWRIVREQGRTRGGDGFRLERNGDAIDVAIGPMGPNEPAFLKQHGLGLMYSVPHGRTDPTGDPRVLHFVNQIGTYVIGRLARDPRAQRARVTDMPALRRFATSVVETLESTYARELDAEPLHDMAHLGRRHGDKFSKVAVA
jgi:hypothetical protein